MSTFDTTLNLSADYIDVRDIIERVEEIEKERDGYDADAMDAWRENYPGDEEELAGLMAILDDLKGNGGDHEWRGDWYPVSLIADSYWEQYAKEYADEVAGMNDREMNWPFCHIDWSAAADSLQMDYASVEIDGNEYWYR